MFFESFLPTDYEVTTNKHIIHKSRVVIEKRLTLNPDFVADLNKPVVKITKVKKTKKVKEIPNNTSKLQMCKFQQFNFKYTNEFFISLNKEQEDKLSKIYNNKDLKHLVLHTYSNDKEIATKRLEAIYNLLPPKLRVLTIYKQDLCYESNLCDTTNIKLIY